jgi:hypothetical protein
MIHDASSKFQPDPQKPNDDWADDLLACVKWLRSCAKKTIRHKDAGLFGMH